MKFKVGDPVLVDVSEMITSNEIETFQKNRGFSMMKTIKKKGHIVKIKDGRYNVRLVEGGRIHVGKFEEEIILNVAEIRDQSIDGLID